MQAETLFPQAVDWVVHGGSSALTVVGIALGLKMWRRLDRDESLNSDFPPHRHINGKVIYPKEYQPAPIERLDGQGS